MDMVLRLSQASAPHDVLRVFANGMGDGEASRGYVSLSIRDAPPGHFRITRMLGKLSDQLHMPPEAEHWNRLKSLPLHSGGFLGRIIERGQPAIFDDLDLSGEPLLAPLFSQHRSAMAIPLFDDGLALNWAIFFLRRPRGFSLKNLDESILTANLVGGTVRHVLLAQRLREAHEQIRAEVERIADIQQSLLPKPLPQVPGLTLAADYHIYDQAGGDLYDVVRLPWNLDGQEPGWALMISDASGHGPAATVVSAMMHAVLYAYPRTVQGPAQVLRHANEHLCAKRIESSFVTVFLGFYDPDTKVLTYSVAGHPPPLLKDHATGAVSRLDTGAGLPLGILPEAEYEQAQITLHSGQTLLLYSDGITEARNDAGVMFEVEGIERALSACVGDVNCTLQTLRNFLRAHEGGVRPSDDQTLLAVQVL
jgi:sigma-B regulation protein RsbU (phosphoserine phosphatase)